MTDNYYEILGVNKDASKEEIKKSRLCWTREEDLLLKKCLDSGEYTFEYIRNTFFPYRTNYSLASRAKRLSIINKIGIKDRISIKTIKKFDSNFFNSYTIASCYWAGFLAADGYIYKKRNLIRLKLAIKDYQHLLMFANFINFIGKIQIETVFQCHKTKKIFEEPKKYCIISLQSINMVDNLLKNFNIGENKTIRLLPPPIPSGKDFISSFIAGLIDGDGSIIVSNKKLRITLCGNIEILNWVKEMLQIYFNINSHIYKSGSIYLLVVCSLSGIVTLHDCITSLNLPIMKRKWNKIGIYLDERNSHG